MGQACIYLDEETESMARENAAAQGNSFSRYISKLIRQDAASREWPESFWATYGSISDPTFERPEDPDISTLRPAPSFD
ncbi:MAG: CopG family transcriptional regulator [Coriobacteriia bacterium]|nr:CopG family transcriptional regulator [Coriobacteriia bacterium]